MDEDIKYLKETLRLAKKGLSWTNPNPMVGAVIVKDGQIIGQGYHRRAGLPHAEIEALNSVKRSPRGATLYVNLEPCSHYGKTPPCTDAIITSGVKRVVCATKDPNPKVNGKGLATLKKACIETSVGILENEARLLNRTFFTFHEKKRPFVALKFAASLDGKLATSTGNSKWITNEKARIYARGLRSKYQAVVVGINTILKDNPHLGARIKGKKDPLRVVLGSKTQIPKHSQILRDPNILITSTDNIPDLLSMLKQKGIISILVEGGGKTLGKFVDCQIIDEVYAFHAPILLGGKTAVSIEGNGAESISKAIYLKNLSFKKFGDNILTIGYV
ncbi:bifunctional diaminohydroxyphosphoribosylaminopyrimidine deaminase/5-amino-6-(5-phosphoribosylamino)uracil reductase RibD [Candidatus Daviesbacteria bacterium]|nr:bifunctional diaminohydroxyphosphoribosylaminopyrimidine deaminase/5-amino-6-(5-phosphoribosylamino)uracil reductase RibD [Candidatus Daviesbacteria bacterium]